MSDTTDNAPIVGACDPTGLKFYCLACAAPDWPRVHGDSDPEYVPPVCAKCGKELRATEATQQERSDHTS